MDNNKLIAAASYASGSAELLQKIIFLNKNSKNNNILNILERKYNRDLSKIKDYLENLEK